MRRLTPPVVWVLVFLLAGCATAASDQPSATASAPATSSASPALPPPAPTNVIVESSGGEQPGTMITFHLTWTGAAVTDAYRIYKYSTGEVPNPRCVFDRQSGGTLLLGETQPGATSVEVKLDAAETGAGTRCLYVIAVNAAGESSPVLAWDSSD